MAKKSWGNNLKSSGNTNTQREGADWGSNLKKVDSSIDTGYNPSTADGLSFTASKEGDITQYEDYFNEGHVFMDNREALNKARAQNQSKWAQAKGFLNQAAAEVGGGILEGTGYLLDLDFWMGEQEDADYGAGNILTELGKGWKDAAREGTPIYQENPGTFDMGDFGWWMQNAVSAASVASIAIPAFGWAKATSLVGKGLNIARKSLVKSKKYRNAVDKLVDAAPSMGNTTRNVLKNLNTSIASRHIENRMEAAGVYEEQYNKLLQAGLSEEEAKVGASKAGAITYRTGWAMMAMDFPQYMMLGRIPKVSKGISSVKLAKAAGTSKTLAGLSYGKKLAAGMASEALEEALQFGIAEEAKYISDLQSGIGQKKTFGERLSEYSKSGDMWTAAFFGGLGGGVFQTVGPKLSSVVQNNLLSKTSQALSETDARINEIRERNTRIASNVAAYKEAVDSGDERAVHSAKQRMAYDIGATAGSVGNLDIALNEIESLKEASEEKKKQLGIDEDFIANIDQYKKDITEAADIWARNKAKLEPSTVDPVSYRQYLIQKYNQDLPGIRKERAGLEQKIPRFNELSPSGKRAFEAKLGISAKQRYIKGAESMLKAGNVSKADAARYRESINQEKEQINTLKESLDSIIKDDEDTQLSNTDRMVLRTLDGKATDEISVLKSTEVWMDNLTNQYINEINELTSNEGQQAARESIDRQANEVEKGRAEGGLQRKKEAEDNTITGSSELNGMKLSEIDQGIQDGSIEEANLSTNIKTALANYRQTGQDVTPNPVDLETFDSTDVNARNIKKEYQDTANAASSHTQQEIPNNSNFEEDYSLSEDLPSTELATLNALAWKSVNNERAEDVDNTEANIALSNFLEGPYSIEGVDLSFSIDFDRLNEFDYRDYEVIKKALANKELPGEFTDARGNTDQTLGKVPVKASFMKDGKPLEFEGTELSMNLHDDDYYNFREDIAEISANKIREQKRQIIEAYFNGQTLTSKIVSKSNGHLVTKRKEDGSFEDFNLNDVIGKTEDIEFVYGSNEALTDLDGKPNQDLGSYKAKDGAIYAKVATANGTPFPLRLQTKNISSDEALLIYDLYLGVLQDGGNYKTSLSPNVIEAIKQSLPELETFLDLETTTTQQLLDHLVVNGFEKTKGKGESRLYFTKERKNEDGTQEPSKVYFGDVAMPLELFKTDKGLEKFTEHLKNNRRRAVDTKLLNNKEFKKHLIESNTLNTNVSPTPNGNLFVQPTIAFNPNIGAEKEGTDTKSEWESFVDTGKVSEETISTIADKVSEGIALSPEEQAVRQEYASEVENLLVDKQVGVDKPITTTDNQAVGENDLGETVTTTVPDSIGDTESQEDRDARIKSEIDKLGDDFSDAAFKTHSPELQGFTNIDGAEVAHIRKILPKNLAVTLEKDYLRVLNQGEVVTGLFANGMIQLSEKARKGDGYHEAFHAVFRTMILNSERDGIYSEARELFPKPSKEEIQALADTHTLSNDTATLLYYEEKLADEFALFMDGASTINYKKTYPKGISGLFQRLGDWVKGVFSTKVTIDKLFNNIKKGGYRKSPVYTSRAVAFKTYRHYSPSQVKAITKQLSYFALKDVKDINSTDQAAINNIDRGIAHYILEAEKSGDLELKKRLQDVWDNDLPFFKGEVVKYLDSLASEVATTKKSWESSTKDNATLNTKVLIASTPAIKSYQASGGKDYDMSNSYLGLPQMVDFDSVWNKLQDNLTGIVPVFRVGVMQDPVQTMMDEILKLSTYHPEIGAIYDNLMSKSDKVKTEFYSTFSKDKGVYVDHLITKEDGKIVSRIATSNNYAKDKLIREGWSNTFKDKVGKAEGKNTVYDPAKLTDIKNEYVELRNSIRADFRENFISPETIDRLNTVLDKLGVDISKGGLQKALDNQEIVRTEDIELNDLQALNTLIISMDKALGSGLFTRSGEITESNNHLLDESFFLKLADFEAEFKTLVGEDLIVGPDNNQVWPYQNYNAATKSVANWKAGNTTFLKKLIESPYGANSIWAKELLDVANDGKDLYQNISNFETLIFGNYKNPKNNAGSKDSDLTEADKLNDIINKQLSGFKTQDKKGLFTGLTKANGGQQLYIKGPKLVSSELVGDDLGENIEFSSNNPNAVKVLMGYLSDELSRMEHAWVQVNGTDSVVPLSGDKQIKGYHYKNTPGDNKGSAFKSFLLPNADLTNAEGGLGLISQVTGRPLVKTLDRVENNPLLIQYLTDTFINSVKENIQVAKDAGIIKEQYGELSNGSIDSDLMADYYQGDVVKAMGDYTLNSLIGNVETTKLFTGDPALYGTAENFARRNYGAFSGGTDFRVYNDINGIPVVRPYYNSAVVESISGVSSDYFTNEKNLAEIATKTGLSLSEAKKAFKNYENINHTDGQAWITLDTYKERMNGLGKWTEGHEAAYQRELSGENPSVNDVVLLSQPLKTVHSELKPHYGTLSMQYNKQSEAVLLPSMIKGTGLADLNEAMRKQGVDHVIVSDAKKVGAIGTTEITNVEGTLKDTDDILLNPLMLSYNNLFLQQDFKSQGLKDMKVGSQPTKNIIGLIDPNETYLDGKSGKDLISEYNEVIAKLSNQGLETFKKDLGYTEDLNSISLDKLYSTLSKEMKQQLPETVQEAFENRMPIDAIPQARKQVEKSVSSMLVDKTVNLKQLGGSFIQMSDFGLTGDNIDLTKKVGNNIIWFKNPSERLQPMKIDKGSVKPSEILIPHSKLTELISSQLGVDYKELSANQIKDLIDSEVLKGISYRVPNQDASSTDVVEIVGILPPEMGDTIVSYKEITTKNGSDFDIDKAYVILPEFTYDKVEGKVVKSGGLKNRRLDIMKAALLNPKAYGDVVGKSSVKNDLEKFIDKTFKESPKEPSLGLFSGLEQFKRKNIVDNSKPLIGMVSNHIINHNLTVNEEGLYYQEDMGTPYHFNVGVSHPSEEKASPVSVKKDSEGNSVEKNLSALMDSVVDSNKNAFIFKANFNKTTANVALTLTRAGAPLRWTTSFIGQPILKELAGLKAQKLYDKESTRDRTTGKALNDVEILLQKYGATTNENSFKADLDPEREFSLQELVSNIEGEQESSAYKRGQLEVLNKFLEVRDKADKLSKLVSATKIGSDSNPDSIENSENTIRDILEQQDFANVEDFLGLELNEMGSIESKGTKLTGIYYKNVVEAAKDVLSSLYLESTPSVALSLDSILRSSGYINSQGPTSKIKAELFAAVNSESPLALDSKALKELLSGKDSITKRIKKAKVDPTLKDNVLIQTLSIKTGENNVPSTLFLPSRGLSTTSKNELTTAWEEILRSDNKLGEDLIKYAYHGSGLTQNLGSFHDLIPSEWLRENSHNDFIAIKQIELSENPYGVVDYEAQVFKHNFNDNSLVPEIDLQDASSFSNIDVEEAFYLTPTKDKSFIAGVGSSQDAEFKRFIKTKDNLYELAGYTQGKIKNAVYTKTNKLGLNNKGSIIKEYGNSGNISIFEENNVSLPQEVKNFTDKLIPPGHILAAYEGAVNKNKPTEEEVQEIQSRCNSING